MYFRVLDLAFGLIESGVQFLHMSVILAVVAKTEDYLLQSRTYKEFREMLLFSSKFIFDGEDFINVILHLRLDLQSR